MTHCSSVAECWPGAPTELCHWHAGSDQPACVWHRLCRLQRGGCAGVDAIPTEAQPHTAMLCTLQVVLLDPMYDAYGPMCRRAGGVPKLVPLDPETWDIRCPFIQCHENPVGLVQRPVAL